MESKWENVTVFGLMAGVVGESVAVVVFDVVALVVEASSMSLLSL